jgi:hypothetical protein
MSDLLARARRRFRYGVCGSRLAGLELATLMPTATRSSRLRRGLSPVDDHCAVETAENVGHLKVAVAEPVTIWQPIQNGQFPSGEVG